MLQKNNGSYQREINSFFDSLGVSASSFPTSSALCQARSKLSPNAFIELNRTVGETFYQYDNFRTWKGHRILGVDGSTLQLPKHDSIKEEFGVHKFGPKADSENSLGRISYLYDVLNGLVLDAQLEGFETSESDLAWRHLSFVKASDVVLYDRYYPSLPLMCTLKSMGANFCFRMKNNWWIKVRKFAESDETDKDVFFKLPQQYRKWAQDNDIPELIRVRLIKKKRKNGEVEIFCTSLLNREKYNKNSVCNLYKERWSIEEGYKLIKARLEVEDFSGVKSIVVKQDFFSKTLLLTLNAILCKNIKPSRKKSRTRVISVNKVIGLSTTKKLFQKFALNWQIPDLVQYYTQILIGKFNYSRKGQSTSRSRKNYKKFSMSYKTA